MNSVDCNGKIIVLGDILFSKGNGIPGGVLKFVNIGKNDSSEDIGIFEKGYLTKDNKYIPDFLAEKINIAFKSISFTFWERYEEKVITMG